MPSDPLIKPAGGKRPRKRGGRRPGAGRPRSPLAKNLHLAVDPRDGILDELLAVSKLNGATAEEIAVSILLFNRGRFHLIAERMKVRPLVVGTPPRAEHEPVAGDVG